jgi:hypothetical protein
MIELCAFITLFWIFNLKVTDVVKMCNRVIDYISIHYNQKLQITHVFV